MPCGSIDDLVDAGEGERILWTGLVKVFEIDTKAPGFVLFWYHYQVCYLVRMFYISDESGF